MSYRDALHYLISKTEVLELSDDYGGHIAVCPRWSGRVMTSTCDGNEGDAFGFLNIDEIERWASSDANHEIQGTRLIGGEDQFVLAPQGGALSVDDANSTRVPSGWTEGAYTVHHAASASHIVMQRRVAMANRLGTPFTLDLLRHVRLLNLDDIEQTFGAVLTEVLQQRDASFVAFETVNTMTNRGDAMQSCAGLVAPHIAGMFSTCDRAVAVLPFQAECAIRQGVTPHYFGLAPHQRLWASERSVAIRADGEHRTQVGATYFCAIPFVGAIDFREGAITLVTWSLPPRASEPYYIVNAPCHTDYPDEANNDTATIDSQENGDAVRIYASGGMLRSDQFHPRFYQIDTASPAQELDHGASITQMRQTVHIIADHSTLCQIAAHFLHCDYDALRERVM